MFLYVMKRNVGIEDSVGSFATQGLHSASTAVATVTNGEVWSQFFNIFSYSLFGPQ
jgi:hypothetical protein